MGSVTPYFRPWYWICQCYCSRRADKLADSRYPCPTMIPWVRMGHDESRSVKMGHDGSRWVTMGHSDQWSAVKWLYWLVYAIKEVNNHDMPQTWQLSWPGCRIVLVGTGCTISHLGSTNGYRNHSSPLWGTISGSIGSLQSDSVFAGWRDLTLVHWKLANEWVWIRRGCAVQ